MTDLRGNLLTSWSAHLQDLGWDAERVGRVEAALRDSKMVISQAHDDNSPLKRSFYLGPHFTTWRESRPAGEDGQIAAKAYLKAVIEPMLEASGLTPGRNVHTAVSYDPKQQQYNLNLLAADKKVAMEWVLGELNGAGLSTEARKVAGGNAGNDLSMVSADHGVEGLLVGNASQATRDQATAMATKTKADIHIARRNLLGGVLEGLDAVNASLPRASKLAVAARYPSSLAHILRDYVRLAHPQRYDRAIKAAATVRERAGAAVRAAGFRRRAPGAQAPAAL